MRSHFALGPRARRADELRVLQVESQRLRHGHPVALGRTHVARRALGRRLLRPPVAERPAAQSGRHHPLQRLLQPAPDGHSPAVHRHRLRDREPGRRRPGDPGLAGRLLPRGDGVPALHRGHRSRRRCRPTPRRRRPPPPAYSSWTSTPPLPSTVSESSSRRSGSSRTASTGSTTRSRCSRRSAIRSGRRRSTPSSSPAP